MKFNEFVKLYANKPYIDSSTFFAYGNENNLRRMVFGWTKKGYLLPLKKGVYVFSSEFRKIELSPFFVANFLVTPSYVSLEYAMSYYGLIPEMATVYTSVTSKKTRVFNNFLGKFEYKSIKNNLFFGYKFVLMQGQNIFFAEPEKALLDLFYFYADSEPDFDYFESLRLQNLGLLSDKKLGDYKKSYNKRVRKIVSALIRYKRKQKSEYTKL